KIHPIDGKYASGVCPTVIDAIQLPIVRPSYNGIMSRPNDLALYRPYYGQDLFAVAKLPPLPVCVYIVRRRKAYAVSIVLPVSAAEHFKIAALAFEDRRTFDGVPTHTAFFLACGVVDLPVILGTCYRTRPSLERFPVKHSVDDRAGSD